MPDAKNPSPITHHPSRIPYFPGCALKDQAEAFEESARAAMAALGYELAELGTAAAPFTPWPPTT